MTRQSQWLQSMQSAHSGEAELLGLLLLPRSVGRFFHLVCLICGNWHHRQKKSAVIHFLFSKIIYSGHLPADQIFNILSQEPLQNYVKEARGLSLQNNRR